MTTSRASATWDGDLKSGKGTMKPGHGGEVSFSAGTRFEGVPGGNPEELIGAALSGCFSMALSGALARAGMRPESVRTTADVFLEKGTEGYAITRIELRTEVRASGGDEATFAQVAEEARKGCPVSKALRPEVTLEAKLLR